MNGIEPPRIEKPDYGMLVAFPLLFGAAGLVLFGLFSILGAGPRTYSVAQQNQLANEGFQLFVGGGAALGFALALLKVLSTAARNGSAQARYKAAVTQRDREQKLSRESAQSRYATNYAEYLPKWLAWCDALKAYETELVAYEAWRPKFVAAWQAYRERGVKAAELFETIHENVEKRGRLELELSKPEHLTALFREAIAVAAKAHPDLGMLGLVRPKVSAKEPPWRGAPYSPLTRKELEEYNWQVFPVVEGGRVNHRQVNPLISHNMPELAYLLDDPRLEAVRDLLPPLPPLDRAGGENRSRPEKPMRPTPPEGLIFFNDGRELSPPVPPEKVVWS